MHEEGRWGLPGAQSKVNRQKNGKERPLLNPIESLVKCVCPGCVCEENDAEKWLRSFC